MLLLPEYWGDRCANTPGFMQGEDQTQDFMHAMWALYHASSPCVFVLYLATLLKEFVRPKGFLVDSSGSSKWRSVSCT